MDWILNAVQATNTEQRSINIGAYSRTKHDRVLLIFYSYVNPSIDPLVLHQKSSSSPSGGSIRHSCAFAGFFLAIRVEFGADSTPREGIGVSRSKLEDCHCNPRTSSA